MPAGFIGLGQMGLGMARNLLKLDQNTLVYDIAPGPVAALVAAGATAAVSIQQIAQTCDVVFLCLPDDRLVREVVFGAGGLADAGRPLTIVDTTTLDIGKCQAIGAEAVAAGLGYVDCPVSGMPPRAADGTLTSLFGGSVQEYARLAPLIAGYSREVVHCGALGAGQMAKAVNNIIYDVNIAVLCEVLPLAVKAGLGVDVLRQIVLGGSAASAAGARFVPKMAARDFTDDFSMKSAYKDIENIQKIAVDAQAMTPVVNAMIATYQQALAAGYGDAPKSSMIKLYEQVLGVTFQDAPGDKDTGDKALD